VIKKFLIDEQVLTVSKMYITSTKSSYHKMYQKKESSKKNIFARKSVIKKFLIDEVLTISKMYINLSNHSIIKLLISKKKMTLAKKIFFDG
jgi:hypothetical protein